MSLPRTFLFFCLLLCSSLATSAQKYSPTLFNCLKWRNIGPFRGGRTIGACGDLQHPNIFYIGVNNGGVWKTTDYGRTWVPIFDDQPTGSIGDVAVAPSNPNTIYVASGEGVQRPDLSVGNGMYKSTDAGKTWKHLGLEDGLQIGGLAIDPKNENKVFAAVLGHPYGPNKERGVYRTADGGKTWENVLFIDENTGAIQVTIDPADNNIVYADMFASRLAPWENGQWSGAGSGLYKSTDGGKTWKQLKGGLPGREDGLSRIGFCIAPSMHNRLFAVVSANEKTGGLYRSNDGGETWQKMSGDPRLWDRGDDFAEVKVDPKNPDIVYDANVVVWKSTDGGKTWKGWKGAPGGDDYHRLWINPANTDVILLASDQGAGITVNGGTTWSSWYNQPTAQLYHVSADNDFPYNVYSGQQESGSVGISSRGNDGAITFRDWHPVGAQEYGYVVADPLDPNIVYGGKLSRYDKRTGQTQDISPRSDGSMRYRFIRTAPVLFSPIDNKTLYYAGNVLFRTRNGGNSWEVISPDLTRKTWNVPECVGVYKDEAEKTKVQRGVIYTVALSPLDSNIIWAGTDDGLIWITKNGGKDWENITPPAITDWSKISLMDASHTDKNTAYVAVNRIRLDDLHPHIYRTRDGGQTWKEIVNGLPNDPINVVKEDPIRKGLLFAGSEKAVYVSFDDGEYWQSLRMNMPATSIRDLVIKDDDIVVATHGRSFWIMDDITALRQINAAIAQNPATLYKPATATRVRWNMNTDTPLPQDEPTGENPPDGALIDYYLAQNTGNEVVLEIQDPQGHVVRHYSSKDTLIKIPEVNIPLYWVRPQHILSSTAGAHRFIWDMHYQPLNQPPSFAMSAIYENTAPAPTGPWVMPGNYTVKLIVDGKAYTQPITIKMDPRVKTTKQDLQQQFDLSYQCYNDELTIHKTLKQINKLNTRLAKLQTLKNKDIASQIAVLTTLLDKLANPKSENYIGALSGALAGCAGNIQGADVAPTTQQIKSVNDVHEKFIKSQLLWETLKSKLEILNHSLKKEGIEALKL